MTVSQTDGVAPAASTPAPLGIPGTPPKAAKPAPVAEPEVEDEPPPPPPKAAKAAKPAKPAPKEYDNGGEETPEPEVKKAAKPAPVPASGGLNDVLSAWDDE